MIIPVFDVKNAMCVSGKSGNRSTYTKLNSIYGDDALEIASGLKKSGAKLLYVADLDKIENKGNNSELISDIDSILPVLLDNGACCREDVESNLNICSYTIIATESMDNIMNIEEIFGSASHDKLIISIDLLNDELLVKNKSIGLDDVVKLVNKVKPIYTIILNISEVGSKKGITGGIVQEIIEKTPYTQHIIGGGLTYSSIVEYKKEGIDNFLVGTALHEGNLSLEDNW